MQTFSISNKEVQDKIKTLFDSNSSNGFKLNQQQVLKFVTELGLNNYLFLSDLNYYYPSIKLNGLTYNEILKFLDFVLTNKKSQEEKIEAFKCLDKNGTGQVNAAELLIILKKKISPKDYDTYSQLISSSYGPLINYMDIFNKGTKCK